jgi:hypothetical protein
LARRARASFVPKQRLTLVDLVAQHVHFQCMGVTGDEEATRHLVNRVVGESIGGCVATCWLPSNSRSMRLMTSTPSLPMTLASPNAHRLYARKDNRTRPLAMQTCAHAAVSGHARWREHRDADADVNAQAARSQKSWFGVKRHA